MIAMIMPIISSINVNPQAFMAPGKYVLVYSKQDAMGLRGRISVQNRVR
jgi:hypothetical protein